MKDRPFEVGDVIHPRYKPDDLFTVRRIKYTERGNRIVCTEAIGRAFKQEDWESYLRERWVRVETISLTRFELLDIG